MAAILTHPPRRAETRYATGRAAASEEASRTLRYVEPLSDARTPLEDFFSILLQNEFQPHNDKPAPYEWKRPHPSDIGKGGRLDPLCRAWYPHTPHFSGRWALVDQQTKSRTAHVDTESNSAMEHDLLLFDMMGRRFEDDGLHKRHPIRARLLLVKVTPALP